MLVCVGRAQKKKGGRSTRGLRGNKIKRGGGGEQQVCDDDIYLYYYSKEGGMLAEGVAVLPGHMDPTLRIPTPMWATA